MHLDRPHQEFMAVALDALAEWRATLDKPAKDTPGGSYQVFDYPRLKNATAFLFYWPASLEITFAGFMPPEAGQSQRQQLEFVTHMSRLMGQLGFPVEVHGPKQDHPFKPLDATAAAARLRTVAGTVSTNRGYVLIGLAEDNRRDGDPEPEAESPAIAADDGADDE
jgi:hypothetical protein